MENLFWPLYYLSPNATIIFVHRRPDERDFDWSDEYINPNFAYTLLVTTVLMSPPFVLPWHLLPWLLDPFLGGRIQQRLQSGHPPLSASYDPYTAFWHAGLSMRRSVAHRYGGLHWKFSDMQGERPYERYLAHFWSRVPTSRVKEWYGPSSKWEELCKLVGVEPCPWSGPLPERTIVPDFKFDYMGAYWWRVPFHLLLLWLNCLWLKLWYKVTMWLLRLANPVFKMARLGIGGLWRVLRVVLPLLMLGALAHAIVAPIQDLRTLQALMGAVAMGR